MKEVFLIYWDYIHIEGINYFNGVSLHLSLECAKKYMSSIYETYTTKSIDLCVAIDDVIVVSVSDSLYRSIGKYKMIRLSEIEFNNLCNIEDIILDY